jgi:hypothetical protein
MSTAGGKTRLGLNLSFKDYLLENVYLHTTESQRAEIVALWQTEGAGIKGDDADRSSYEAVFLIRTQWGELAGVATVALVRLKKGGRFYSYSMFLRKRDRVSYLMLTTLNATRDFLRNFKHPVSQPVGMLSVSENPKLMRPGARKILARHGYKLFGQTARGEDVWLADFSEPEPRSIRKPQGNGG